ncbi:NUDIX hydrolase [Patescibacteria group bacterium]|nr:NUDIX hydrolase [Patescibacteria group bacterium]
MTRLPSDLVPWDKIGDPTILAGKFGKSLISQMFRSPAGTLEEYTFFGQNDWSVVLPVTTDGLVITNHEYKQGCHQVIHELPAGVADFSAETPEAVMRRELMQETGYEPAEVIFLGPPLFMASRSSWTRFHAFLATGCTKIGGQALDETEDIVTELVPLDDWIRLCLSQLIEPSAIVTTFRSLPHLGYSFTKE